MSDLHCNCSFRGLFGPPLPFALLEEELPIANLSAEHFQVHNYILTLAITLTLTLTLSLALALALTLTLTRNPDATPTPTPNPEP